MMWSILLFLLGICAGGFVNLAIYRFAWNRRWISPWSGSPTDVDPRNWLDRLPIVGWLRLRRETEYHGRGFWIRPLLLECSIGFATVWFYDAAYGGLLYPNWLPLPGSEVLHGQINPHLVLFGVLIACTFVDFDEKTIPDELTVPGTLFALIYLSLMPSGLLPDALIAFRQPIQSTPLWLSPHGALWPSLEAGTITGLLAAMAAWGTWGFALLHKTCTLRKGLFKGVTYMLVSSYRRGSWIWMLPVFMVGCLFITIAWWRGGDFWLATLTSLAGIVFGGGMIWLVRVVGTVALQQEAMGFGDVTLMAMIGALLGWQSTVIIFFLAPAAAVLIAVAQYLTTVKHQIAFGPYLALAAVGLVCGWSQVWFVYVRHYFALGWLLPTVTVLSLFGMGAMLWVWRLLRDTIWPIQEYAVATRSDTE